MAGDEMTVKKKALLAVILLTVLALCIVGGGVFVMHSACHECSHYGCRVCCIITQIRATVSDICAIPGVLVVCVAAVAAMTVTACGNNAASGTSTPVSLKVKLSS